MTVSFETHPGHGEAPPRTRELLGPELPGTETSPGNQDPQAVVLLRAQQFLDAYQHELSNLVTIAVGQAEIIRLRGGPNAGLAAAGIERVLKSLIRIKDFVGYYRSVPTVRLLATGFHPGAAGENAGHPLPGQTVGATPGSSASPASAWTSQWDGGPLPLVDAREALGESASMIVGETTQVHWQCPVNGTPTPPEDTPALVRINPVRLRQVFTNLLLNALQATQRLPITHRVIRVGVGLLRFTVVAPKLERVPAGAETAWVKVQISNPLPTVMEEAQLALLFEPGYSRRSGGSGLGLTISRAIVEQCGGQLVARLEDGWIVFEMHLPAVPIPSTAAPPLVNGNHGFGEQLHPSDGGINGVNGSR